MSADSLTVEKIQLFELFCALDADDLEKIIERHFCVSIAEEQVLVQESD
jgi:hypothetical protein